YRPGGARQAPQSLPQCAPSRLLPENVAAHAAKAARQGRGTDRPAPRAHGPLPCRRPRILVPHARGQAQVGVVVVTRPDHRTGDLPLLGWADELRRTHTVRRRRRIRFGAVALLIGLVGAIAIVPPTPRLVWNVSASAPVGLYAVAPGAALARGDM